MFFFLETKYTSNAQNDPNAKKNSPLSLFWPNTIAECDTSFLEGSTVYTSAKLPYIKNGANVNVPDLLTCSTGSNQPNNVNNFVNINNSSYNSSGSTNTSNPNNIFSSRICLICEFMNIFLNVFLILFIKFILASTSSLLLNGNVNNLQPNYNLAEKYNINFNTNPQNICTIFTHTGSPNTTDNE